MRYVHSKPFPSWEKVDVHSKAKPARAEVVNPFLHSSYLNRDHDSDKMLVQPLAHCAMLENKNGNIVNVCLLVASVVLF